MQDFIDPFLPVAIGSFPHRDPQAAISLIFKHLPRFPLWPQLPKKDFRENMYVQYSKGMPSLVIDQQHERIFMDTSHQAEAELEVFYSHALEEDLEYFAFPDQYASGFWAFLDSMRSRTHADIKGVKGQVTGPFSFGLSVVDEHQKAVLYNQTFYEAVVTAISLHAQWQVRKLKELHSNVLIFIDEPYLVSFGSAYVSVDRETVIGNINQVIEGIHKGGALAGVHCCGNTDWSLILDTNLDLLNFDAFQFFENLVLYVSPLQRFLERGGILAWGIVPSDEIVADIDVDTLEQRLQGQIEQAVNAGLDRDLLMKRSLLSPACGLGSLSIPLAEEALTKLESLSGKLGG